MSDKEIKSLTNQIHQQLSQKISHRDQIHRFLYEQIKIHKEIIETHKVIIFSIEKQMSNEEATIRDIEDQINIKDKHIQKLKEVVNG
tara:strand:+ start:242 stop:502 length:261 start_codon:yes stop_codon:yes gene_type:complete